MFIEGRLTLDKLLVNLYIVTMKRLERDEKRDKELITDYNAKMPMWEMTGKYEISNTRIYQILDFHKVPRRTKKGSNDQRQSKTSNR